MPPRYRTEPDFPVRTWNGGEPVPELSQIPTDRWREVLAPLSQATRRRATHGAGSNVSRAFALLGELELDDAERRRRAGSILARPEQPPAPGAGRRRERRRPQVGVRLGPIQLERLDAAARELGLRRTQLARMLVVNGVNRLLYETRRRAEERPGEGT